MKPIPCSIFEFFHCRKCVESVPAGESPATWARLGVGFTPEGIQVWCTRHDENVMALDFLGQKIDFAKSPGEKYDHH